MSLRTGYPLALQALWWAAANSIAGVAVGLGIGAFRAQGPEPILVGISVLYGNVVGFTVLFTSIVLYPRLRALGPVARGAVLVSGLSTGAVVGTVLVGTLFPLYVVRDVRQTAAVALVNAALALVVGGVTYAYEGMRQQLAMSLREAHEARIAEARLREEAARAELAALQARINPHFFFNTLNTISSLLDDDPERAQDVVETLARLFRYAFRVSDTRLVPLSDELAFLEDYLTIERARFGDRLQVLTDIDEAASDVRVPGLILQPLVENAVLHGVAPRARGGTITITAIATGDGLALGVRDDGVGFDGDAADTIRDGHGLGNVRRRLRPRSGDGADLTLERVAAGGTLARIVVPSTDPAEAGSEGEIA
jgi:LytS/YehU family sensor histidine kinase